MNVMKKIAIIGATGMLGIPVTIALLDAGFAVTALARKPGEARRVLPAATRIVEIGRASCRERVLLGV